MIINQDYSGLLCLLPNVTLVAALIFYEIDVTLVKNVKGEKVEEKIETNFINHALEFLEKEVGIPKESYLNMTEEDDWSFIIKLSATIEQSLNFLNCKGVKEPFLIKILESQGLERKLKTAQEREFIDKDSFKRLYFIKDVRNAAAHKIKFSFKEYLRIQRNHQKYKSLYKDVWNENLSFGPKGYTGEQFSEENPKLTLWFYCLEIIAFSDLNSRKSLLRKEYNESIESLGKFINSLLEPKPENT